MDCTRNDQEGLTEPIKNITKDVGFEVPTAMLMKTTIFCSVTARSSVKVHWWFGRTYRLHLQKLRAGQARRLHASLLLAPYLAFSSTLICSSETSADLPNYAVLQPWRLYSSSSKTGTILQYSNRIPKDVQIDTAPAGLGVDLAIRRF
jgi:hypothetical protein